MSEESQYERNGSYRRKVDELRLSKSKFNISVRVEGLFSCLYIRGLSF